jgi:hypothetical protein
MSAFIELPLLVWWVEASHQTSSFILCHGAKLKKPGRGGKPFSVLKHVLVALGRVADRNFPDRSRTGRNDSTGQTRELLF